MAKKKDGSFDYANNVLSDLFNSPKPDLREYFERRIDELGISSRTAQNELDIEYRALKGILDGTQKMVDVLALSRLADFLQIPVEKVFNMLLEKLEENFLHKIVDNDKQKFILKNFDLVKLKKCGFIDTLSDFSHIEDRIVEYFGLKNIYEYGKDFINVVYSSAKPKPENSLMRNFWGESATGKLSRINNPHEYDRAGLIEYIPSIRWYSTDVHNGLFQVIRELYKFGVTVIYEPYLTTIYVRGATLPVNDKPCIVLTNYTDYYPTLWFALIHEIHHVLFDWQEIRRNKPHFSGEIDRFDKKEVEADTFAREYLFSGEKMKVVSPQIGNETFVNRYARAFDVHPSLIYSLYCWENLDSNEDVYKKYGKHLIGAREALVAIDPDSINDILLKKKTPVKVKSRQLREGVFNGL